MIEKTRRYLTVSDGPGKATIGRWADIDDQGYVDGETPIEDYPFYLLTDFPVSEEYAWKVWIEERPWNYAPEGAPEHYAIEWACPKKV